VQAGVLLPLPSQPIENNEVCDRCLSGEVIPACDKEEKA